MDDWKSLIDAAMQQEATDTIAAHATYGKAVHAGLAQAQGLLGDLMAQIMAIYGPLVAYSQQVMEMSDNRDRSSPFRTGPPRGVSVSSTTSSMSSRMWQASPWRHWTTGHSSRRDPHPRAAGLTVELDAKGDVSSKARNPPIPAQVGS